MKIAAGFLAGMITCSLIMMFICNWAVPARAEESSELSNLLPDFGKIYRAALASPFQQVEKEIYDADIANFYHGLMEKTGLNEITVE